jgi:hypothetical protein
VEGDGGVISAARCAGLAEGHAPGLGAGKRDTRLRLLVRAGIAAGGELDAVKL